MDQTPSKEPRSPINLRIKFRSESLEQFVERYAIDVSRGGIFIRTREPLAVGTQLKLDFQYQSGVPLMAGDGTVVWIREPDPNRPTVPPGMGVRFDRLTPESQVVLEQLLSEKAAREKKSGSGSPTTVSVGARRPSSIFAALEQSQAKTTVGPAPSAPPPVVEPLGTNAPPPRYSVASMPLVAQGIPGSTTNPPATSRGAAAGVAPAAAEPAGPGGYKPLGNARNPFAVGADPAVTKGDPAAVARMAATILGTGAKAPGSLRQLGNAAGGIDDLDDEPTQIASRIPAFLASDEDPTSVGTRPTADDSRITTEHPAATGRNLAGLTSPLNRPTDRLTGSASARQETVRAEAALPGSTARVTGQVTTQAAESARNRVSLDSMPPIAAPSSAPRRNGPEHSTDALLDPEPRLSRAGLGMPEQPRPFDPLAAFGSGPSAVTGTPAPIPVPPIASEPVPAAPATAVAAAPAVASAARTPGKRSSGLMVGALVLVLGGAAFFVFRFFQSQASQVVSAPVAKSPSGATTIAPTEPARPTTGATPDKAEPGAPGAAEVGQAKPSEAKAGEAKPGEAKPDEAKPREGTPAETKAAEPKLAETKPAAASKAGAATEPAGTRKAAKPHKQLRATRDTEAAATEAPASPTPAAAAAGAASPEAAAAGHQIRVTSKPSGADVAIDGQLVGQTPLSAGITDVSSPHFVSVHKEGFEPFEQMISATSAWAKGKSVKGQPAIPTLKLNAKLKSTVAGTTGDAKPGASEGAKEKEAGPKADPDSPVPPSDLAPSPPAP